MAWVLFYRIADTGSLWNRIILMCWREASGRSTRSFPPSWSAGMCMWALALWAVLISRLRMRSLLSDVVEYGMKVQEALETDRWTKQSANGSNFSIEDRSSTCFNQEAC